MIDSLSCYPNIGNFGKWAAAHCDQKMGKAGQKVKVLLEFHNLWYTYIFDVADYHNEFRLSKFKIKDPTWQTNFPKIDTICFKLSIWELFKLLVTISDEQGEQIYQDKDKYITMNDGVQPLWVITIGWSSGTRKLYV